MNEDKIKYALKNKISLITRLAKKINLTFDKDIIHQFRVEIKTASSFLRLLKFQNPGAKLKLPKKFKRLYHITGAIRDAQLELGKIIDKQLELPAYINKLHLVINTRKKEWENHYAKKIFLNLNTKLSNASYDTLHPETLEEFIGSHISFIHQLSKVKYPSDSNIHTVRKLVKDILYISKITKKYWKEGHRIMQQMPLELLDQTADIIGTYHDERLQLDRLCAFASKAMKPPEEKLITALCNDETKKLQKFKTRIAAMITTSAGEIQHTS